MGSTERQKDERESNVENSRKERGGEGRGDYLRRAQIMRSPTLESKCSSAFETSVGEEAEGGGRGADRRLWLGLGAEEVGEG